jgi:ribose 5-phosphate isomerase RpiB
MKPTMNPAAAAAEARNSATLHLSHQTKQVMMIPKTANPIRLALTNIKSVLSEEFRSPRIFMI